MRSCPERATRFPACTQARKLALALAQRALCHGQPLSPRMCLTNTSSPTSCCSDSLSQMDNLLQQMQVSYTDLLLNHWPTSPASPTVDPLCDPKKPTYDEKGCRMSTWRAYVEIWKAGKSLAIGVANYNISHLQEIIDAGMPLPAVNQVRWGRRECHQPLFVLPAPRITPRPPPPSPPLLPQVPFHLYNGASPANAALLAFCKAHNIVVLSYSPLGIPDWHSFPVGEGKLPAATTLEDPVLLQVTAAHPGATPAQVVLAWLWAQGIPSNPRTMNASHMRDNLAATAIKLSAAEVALLSSRPLDLCSIDGSFYECVPSEGFGAPASPLRLPQLPRK